MRTNGKSFKQWVKEAETNIVKLGYSEQYANAVVWGLRCRYMNKYNFQDPKTITPNSWREVI